MAGMSLLRSANNVVKNGLALCRKNAGVQSENLAALRKFSVIHIAPLPSVQSCRLRSV